MRIDAEPEIVGSQNVTRRKSIRPAVDGVPPTICPVCQKHALETTVVIEFRRGSRKLPVKTRQWQCPGECVGPKGEAPFLFADLLTIQENGDKARTEWLQHFGETMPLAQRSDQSTEEPCEPAPQTVVKSRYILDDVMKEQGRLLEQILPTEIVEHLTHVDVLIRPPAENTPLDLLLDAERFLQRQLAEVRRVLKHHGGDLWANFTGADIRYKLDAIKLCRDLTGMGLKESRALVESKTWVLICHEEAIRRDWRGREQVELQLKNMGIEYRFASSRPE